MMTPQEVFEIAKALAEADGRRVYNEPLADLTYVEMVEKVIDTMEAIESVKKGVNDDR